MAIANRTAPKPNVLAFEVRGNSMVDLVAGDQAFPRGPMPSYPDGVTIIVDPDLKPEAGRDALFHDGERHLFGRVHDDGTLRPLDGSWQVDTCATALVGVVSSVGYSIGDR
ncbi:MAG: hypothetical protein AAFQ62_06290 [Pseudomonadota bacterium]